MEPFVAAVVVAAGESRRMGTQKQELLLCGKPLLLHTLLAFEAAQTVGEIVVVTRPELCKTVTGWATGYGLTKLRTAIAGGASRQQSVAFGVAACGDFPLVAIHDGARPLITPAAIDRVAAVAKETGAAAAAVRAVDTIKVADAAPDIVATPDRATLWQVQTPQIFAAERYREALATAQKAGVDYTDDCQLMEAVGARVRLVETGSCNLKVTVPEDVALARAVLTERSGG